MSTDREIPHADVEPLYREFIAAVSLNSQVGAELLGLNLTDVDGLNILIATGPLTAGELAARTRISTGATTRMIDRLEAAGYVHRASDPGDRRRVIVKIDPERTRHAEAVFEPVRQRLLALAPEFSDADVEVVVRYLRLSTTALREATREMLDGGKGERADA
ncbi:MAG: MarR family winged helix-turn-helix transcriptional regulator [Streptosporangiales bacterium]